MIRIGDKRIVAGFIGDKPILELWYGNYKVFPPDQSVPAGKITLIPPTSVIGALGGYNEILLEATSRWKASVEE